MRRMAEPSQPPHEMEEGVCCMWEEVYKSSARAVDGPLAPGVELDERAEAPGCGFDPDAPCRAG